MDNLNYVSKKLVAEYRANINNDYKVIEKAYAKEKDKFIIEFDGGKYSIYSIAKTFFDYEPRKGVYMLNKNDFDTWKKIRIECEKQSLGCFISYVLDTQHLLEMDLKNYIETDVLIVNEEDLPF